MCHHPLICWANTFSLFTWDKRNILLHILAFTRLLTCHRAVMMNAQPADEFDWIIQVRHFRLRSLCRRKAELFISLLQNLCRWESFNHLGKYFLSKTIRKIMKITKNESVKELVENRLRSEKTLATVSTWFLILVELSSIKEVSRLKSSKHLWYSWWESDLN